MKNQYPKQLWTSLILLAGLAGFAQPTYDWAKNIGGTANEYVDQLAGDAQGNVFAIGDYTSPVCTIGTIPLMHAGVGGIFNSYLAKFDASGNAVWAKRIATGGSMKIDASGNCYLYYGGNSSLNLIKYDPDGNMIWNKQIGEANEQVGAFAFQIAPSGDIFVSGFLNIGTFQLGTTVLSSVSYNTVAFVAKLDPDGNPLWAKPMSYANITSIAVDASENVYLTGWYGGTGSHFTMEDTTVSNTNDLIDYVVARLNPDGTLHWLYGFGSSGEDRSDAIAADADGNLTVIGLTEDAANLSIGDMVINGGGIYALRFNSGGELLTSKTLATGGIYYAAGDIGASGNIYVGGVFGGTCNFNGVVASVSSVNMDIYTACYHADGTLVWLKHSGATNGGNGGTMALSPSGDLLVGGMYNSPTISFDQFTLTKIGGFDGAVAKIDNTSLANGNFAAETFSIYPNPAQSLVHLYGLPAGKPSGLYDTTGREVGHFGETPETIDISGLAPGVYLLTSEGFQTKIIKQ